MKVLQVPYGFYPDPVGGTEIYVASLSRALQRLGLQIVVSAPSESDSVYRHEDLLVHRYAVGNAPTLDALYGRHDPLVGRAFARVLDQHQPDLVHLHAFTRGISVSVVREAKRRHLPILFTYHTPTVSCQRGTMMRWGREVCDGYVDLGRCTRCALQGLGLPQKVACVVGSVPVSTGGMLGAAGLSGGVWTALRMRQLVDVRSASFHSLMTDVDHVVAVCSWVKSVLLINGVAPDKISVSRHGLDLTNVEPVKLVEKSGPLRVAFLGRVDPAKGLHILIQAFTRLSKAPIELDVYGFTHGSQGDPYTSRVRDLTDGDSRITFVSPVHNSQSISVLRDYDLLAVPSQWLETGPLVVLEAFAAGIPVIGSDLGGIAELVEHDVNGLLVAPGSIGAWCNALQRIVSDSTLLPRLKAGVRKPRCMEDVAREMLLIYEDLADTFGVDRSSPIDNMSGGAAG